MRCATSRAMHHGSGSGFELLLAVGALLDIPTLESDRIGIVGQPARQHWVDVEIVAWHRAGPTWPY